MIEIGKTYQTRNGWQARVHATDMGGSHPVLASVKNPRYGWTTLRTTAEGHYNPLGHASDFDLIEVKPVITLTRWVNVYRDTTQPDGHWLAWHPTEEGVKKSRNANAIMTVPVTIEGEEGEGL